MTFASIIHEQDKVSKKKKKKRTRKPVRMHGVIDKTRRNGY